MPDNGKFLTRGIVAALFLCLTFFVPGLPSVAVNAEGFKTPLIVEKADGSQHAFEVELALTAAQRSMGLMYRTELAPNDGMLFIFPEPAFQRFWMRNTYIPLDIIFVAEGGRIVNIVANAEPRTDTGRESTGRAKAVLELIGGRAAELGITAGDIVRHALLGNMKPGK